MNLRSIFRFAICCGIVFAVCCGASGAEKALKDVLPGDASFIFYTPNGNDLIANFNAFTPGNQVDAPPLTKLSRELPGIAEDWMTKPAATVVYLTIQNGFTKSLTVLLLSADAAQLKDVPEDAAEHLTAYNGFIAYGDTSDDRAIFEHLTAVKDFYEPSAEASKMMDDSNIFLHVNMPSLCTLARMQYQDDPENFLEMTTGVMGFFSDEEIDTLKKDTSELFIKLLAELKSFDIAAKIAQNEIAAECILDVKEGGLLSRYLVAGKTLDVLQPALPKLDYVTSAIWFQADRTALEAYSKDAKTVTDYLAALISKHVTQDALVNGPVPEEEEEAVTALRLIDVYNDRIQGITAKGIKFCKVWGHESGKLSSVNITQVTDKSGIPVVKKALGHFGGLQMDLMKAGISDVQRRTITVDGVEVEKVNVALPKGDDEYEEDIVKGVRSLYGADGPVLYIGAIDNNVVGATSEEELKAAFAAVRGRIESETVTDDPAFSAMVDKVGIDNNLLFIWVPARYAEYQSMAWLRTHGMTQNAPMMLPFATPAGFGVKALDGHRAKGEAYIPQSCIAEVMTVLGSMTGGF